REYDPPTASLPQSATLQTFDLDRNLRSVAFPDGAGLTIDYDNAGRLSTISQPEGVSAYGYDPTTGALISMSSPDGVTLSYDHDGSLIRRATFAGSIAGTIDWTYDPWFRPATMLVS